MSRRHWTPSASGSATKPGASSRSSSWSSWRRWSSWSSWSSRSGTAIAIRIKTALYRVTRALAQRLPPPLPCCLRHTSAPQHRQPQWDQAGKQGRQRTAAGKQQSSSAQGGGQGLYSSLLCRPRRHPSKMHQMQAAAGRRSHQYRRSLGGSCSSTEATCLPS